MASWVREYLTKNLGVSNDQIGFANGQVTVGGTPLNISGMTLADGKSYADPNAISSAYRNAFNQANNMVPVRSYLNQNYPVYNGDITGSAGQVSLNGSPLNISGLSFNSAQGMNYATPEAINAAMSQMGVPSMNYTPANRQQILDMLDSIVPFSYNPKTDTALKQAQSEATQNVMESMNERGILNSTVTSDRTAQEVAKLVPEYENLAYQRYLQGVNTVLQKADFLNKLDTQDLDMFKTKLDAYYQKADYARQKKLDEIAAEDRKIQQQKDRVKSLGYVDNEASLVLGLPVGTLSDEAQARAEDWKYRLKEMQQQLANEKALAAYNHSLTMDRLTSTANSKKAIANMGTPEQVNYYWRLLDTYSGGGGGTYANNPQAALNWLMTHKQQNVNLVGDQLYNQLVSDVKALASSGPKGLTTTSKVSQYASYIDKAFIIGNSSTGYSYDIEGIYNYLNQLLENGEDENVVAQLANKYDIQYEIQ